MYSICICLCCFNWTYESRCFDFVKFQSFSRGFPRPGQKQQRNGWRSPNSLIGVDSQGWCDFDWSWNNLFEFKLMNFHTELWVFEGDRADGLRTCLCVWGIMWFPAPRTLRSERRSGLSWLHGDILLWLHRSQCHGWHFGIYMHFVPLEVQYIAFCAPEVPGSRTSKNMMNKDYELFGCFAPFRSPILVSMAAIAEVERLCAEAPCMVVSADGSVFWKCVHPNAESLNDGICFPHFMIQVVESTICTAFWQRQCCKWFKRPSDIVQGLPAYTWWRTRWESCDMIIYQNKSQMQAFWVILSTEMWDKWIKHSHLKYLRLRCIVLIIFWRHSIWGLWPWLWAHLLWDGDLPFKRLADWRYGRSCYIQHDPN